MRWVATAGLFAATSAYAGKHPRFEPTDLELENPGTIELDLQLGPMRGPDAWRLVAPDFELDVGILPNIELDLDGAYAVEGGVAGGPTFFDHSAPENLWLSAKLGIADWHDDATRTGWAIGVQLGPKLPVATDAHGVGFEGLVLFGRNDGRYHVVLDAGALVDPHDGDAPRPVGIEGGIDLEIEIVPDRWSVLGELGGIYFTSADDDQLATTAGIQYSVTSSIDLSIVGLLGLAAGSDRYGVLFGFSPKLALW